MSGTRVDKKLVAWGVDAMEPGTLDQARRASRLPFVAGHVALMPDAGVGQGHEETSDAADAWLTAHAAPGELSQKQHGTVLAQFGTLGSGNHFLEVCLDERDIVWIVLHSGSRGIGNQLASQHINTAKKLAKQWFLPLEDPDLAYLVQGTPEFTAYITGADLAARMVGRTWNADRASALVDEIPDAYKDIDAVMDAQRDLVEIEHTLHQVFNYKG
jgi:RNA-splicing ligase RtcB